MFNTTAEEILQMVDELKSKSRPFLENGHFNKDNANFNTGLNEGIDILYKFLADKEENDE